MNYSIEIGKGWSEIVFGMTKNQVKERLGDPTEIERYAFGVDESENTEIWHYDDYECSLSFDEDENWQLTSITMSHGNATINGLEIMGMELDEAKEKLHAFDLGTSEVTEETGDVDEPPIKVLSYPEKNLDFWMDEGEVSEIQWGPLFDDEGQYIWPKNQ